MAGADLFEVLGPISDETARKLIVLMGLKPRQQAAPQADDERTADAA